MVHVSPKPSDGNRGGDLSAKGLVEHAARFAAADTWATSALGQERRGLGVVAHRVTAGVA
jgi:hypothetical protein